MVAMAAAERETMTNTNVTNAKWEEVLWTELAELAPGHRFLVIGEWITAITHQLLPELSKQRRLAIVQGVDEGGINAAEFAETVGSRPTTVGRLLDEGRAIRRAQERSDAS